VKISGIYEYNKKRKEIRSASRIIFSEQDDIKMPGGFYSNQTSSVYYVIKG
jgi:hypothetical protein